MSENALGRIGDQFRRQDAEEEGNEEMNEVSGRGWTVLGEDGHLRGRIFIHDGDDSAFEAEQPNDPVKRRRQRP